MSVSVLTVALYHLYSSGLEGLGSVAPRDAPRIMSGVGGIGC